MLVADDGSAAPAGFCVPLGLARQLSDVMSDGSMKLLHHAAVGTPTGIDELFAEQRPRAAFAAALSAPPLAARATASALSKAKLAELRRQQSLEGGGEGAKLAPAPCAFQLLIAAAIAASDHESSSEVRSACARDPDTSDDDRDLALLALGGCGSGSDQSPQSEAAVLHLEPDANAPTPMVC
jgi:hypothetical protein